jgi:UDP-N-acetyl-D-galactosamine dehydrogenase
MVHDPLANAREALHEYGLKLTPIDELEKLDALVLAVSHKWYTDLGPERLAAMVRTGGVLADVKSVVDPTRLGPGVRYWSL